MSVENVVAEILQLKQEFETLCEEACAQIEALEERLSDVEMPASTAEVALLVNLVHPRVIGDNPTNTRSYGQVYLSWSFQNDRFEVRPPGASSTTGTALIDDTDDWAFIELVAAIPRLLPKIEASIGANLPEKRLILVTARAALEACATTREGSEDESPAPAPTPARFQHIG